MKWDEVKNRRTLLFAGNILKSISKSVQVQIGDGLLLNTGWEAVTLK